MQNSLFNPDFYIPMSSITMNHNRSHVDHLLRPDNVSEPLNPAGSVNQQEDEDGEIKEMFTQPVKGNRSAVFF